MNKKSVAIIGEGETEWFYFESLRVLKRYPFKLFPDIPKHSDIKYIVDLAKKYIKADYDYVVCLVDMDIMRNPAEFQKYKLKRKELEKFALSYETELLFIESSPCTEFWFLLHFLPGLGKKSYKSYESLLPELRKYMPGYEKTARYFMRTNLYKYLEENGDVFKAIENSTKLREIAKLSPEDEYSYSEIYKIIVLLGDIMPNT